MQLDFYPHALEQMAERGLTKQEVEAAVVEADEIVEAKFGRKEARKRVGDKVLKVFFEEKNNAYIVVTAYYVKASRLKWLK